MRQAQEPERAEPSSKRTRSKTSVAEILLIAALLVFSGIVAVIAILDGPSEATGDPRGAAVRGADMGGGS